ncbi:hypothetical protein Pcinc_006386 [Petrolisthes cinctipes]|uniref:Alcohol dehydrogenase n=2 Tax=Petrolisthes cinctipes TaxID=88211 RepID=A0AAE1GAR2_PETCI|nr:hypothetical protein Pcinc_006386 [Petrolisthes cinctipes]
MQCLLKCDEGEGFDLVTRPVPTPGPDEVIIKVHKVAICGSDLNLWKWNDLARTIATLPFIPGHEATGEVVALGSEVTEVRLGQRVAVENHFYCTRCFQCKVRSGVAHNAVENLSVVGQDVLVLGCGPIGLLSIAIVKALGGKKVFAVDVNTDRLNLALRMGADAVINSEKEDIKSVVMSLTDNTADGIGRIVEASGAPSMIANCFSWLRKDCKVIPGHYVTAQHRLVTLHLPIMVTQKQIEKRQGLKRIKWFKLKYPEKKMEFKERVLNELEPQIIDVEDWWNRSSGVILRVAREVLGESTGKIIENKETWLVVQRRSAAEDPAEEGSKKEIRTDKGRSGQSGI